MVHTLHPRRLWITRTRPQADATAARVAALGFTPVVAPVLEIQALDGAHEALFEASGDAEALVFTSQTAVVVYAGLRSGRDLPVFAIGEATARAALEAGFDQVETPPPGRGGDVAALANAIALASPRPALVLNPTALEPAADLAALLARRGVTARAVAVYRTVATALDTAPANLHGVLVHSPKGAERVAALITASQAPAMTAWAISGAAAEPLRALPFARISIAEYPNERALLARIAD